MKKAIGAILFRCTDITYAESWHRFYIPGGDSWCIWCTGRWQIIIKMFSWWDSEPKWGIVWTRCPKTIYVSSSIIELGINSAVLHYNEGECGISKVFSYFKIDNGYYMEKGSIKRNKVSIRKMDIKSSESWKTRRKKIRAGKKGIIVKEKENEPSEWYIAGWFRTFFAFLLFDFPGICRNIKHDISKTKQANVLKFSGNLSYFYRSNLN